MKCTTCGQFGHLAASCATVQHSRKGQDNGGIRSLEDIRQRCVVDVEGDCWQWRGALALGTGGRGCPVAWSPSHGRVISVLRLAVEFSGRKLAKGSIVWRTCRCEDCCNPKHLNVGTRKEWGVWTAALGHRKGDPLASARNRKARVDSGDAILTMELARWIRESEQAGVELAHVLGVSATTISRARLRRTWDDALPGASVFGLASQAWREARA